MKIVNKKILYKEYQLEMDKNFFYLSVPETLQTKK